MLGKYFNCRALQTGNQVLQINELLEEENEIQFEGLFCAKTWKFIIPSKKYWINIVIHSIISGLLMISCSKYLLKSTIQQFIGEYVPAEIVIIFSIISLLQAFHALIISTPPETAVFRTHDNLELVPISRSLHMILLTIPYWIRSLNPNCQIQSVRFFHLFSYFDYHEKNPQYHDFNLNFPHFLNGLAAEALFVNKNEK